MFVTEYAFQHQNFLAAGMNMWIEVGMWRPFDERAADAVELMQRHDGKARHQSGTPGGGSSVNFHRLFITW